METDIDIDALRNSLTEQDSLMNRDIVSVPSILEKPKACII